MHALWTQKMCTVDFESDGSWALERVVLVGRCFGGFLRFEAAKIFV
jgi:dienelactone hydrolase